jgi:apolipoprotein N-acyltransferase
MVVQSNHAHLRGGTPTISREGKIAWYLEATQAALRTEHPDLVVWSETVAPPLNEAARRELRLKATGQFMEQTHQALSKLTAEARVTLVTGGYHVGGWISEGTARVATQIRSSVYIYDCMGRQSPERYDKIALCLYSERMPFAGAAPWLHRMLLKLAAPAATQPLTPGDPDALTLFTLRPCESRDGEPAATGSWRFVTPICLENIYPDHVSRLVVGPDGRKRADFVVNVSNDGWFNDMERAQHLQAVTLRCIENRVPMARSSNTGVSGFVDSCGRIVAQLPTRMSGTLTHRLEIDPRVTFYARRGNVFALGCVLVCGMMVLVTAVRRIVGRARA